MSRNHYEPAFGVAVPKWEHGMPSRNEGFRVILVEVWVPSLDIAFVREDRPRVEVEAALQVWRYNEEQHVWQVLNEFAGTWQPVEERASVRRWCTLARRSAKANLTLDAWSEP